MVTTKVQAIMNVYGWETQAEMAAAPEYQHAFKECGGDKEKLLAHLARFQQDLPAWYVGPAKKLKRKPDGTYEVEKHGMRVLTYDGQVRNIYDDVDRTAKGNEISGMAPLMAGPYNVRVNLKDPERPPRITACAETKAVPQEHGHDVPDVPFSATIERAMKKSDKDFHLGCIPGQAQGFFTGTVGVEDDMFVALKANDEHGRTKFDHVKLTITDNGIDAEGNPDPCEVTFKVPVTDINEQFKIDVADEDPESVKELLANEPVAGIATVGVTNPVEFNENLTDDEQSGPWANTAELRAELKELLKGPYLKSVSPKLMKLDLSSEKDATHLLINGMRVYGIEREEGGLWKLGLLATDLGRNPWGSVKETPSKKEGGRPWNEGAYIVFLNQIGVDSSASANTITAEDLDALPDIEV